MLDFVVGGCILFTGADGLVAVLREVSPSSGSFRRGHLDQPDPPLSGSTPSGVTDSVFLGHLDLLDPPLSGSLSLLKNGRIGRFKGVDPVNDLVDILAGGAPPTVSGNRPAETNGFDRVSDFLLVCFVLAIP